MVIKTNWEEKKYEKLTSVCVLDFQYVGFLNGNSFRNAESFKWKQANDFIMIVVFIDAKYLG